MMGETSNGEVSLVAETQKPETTSKRFLLRLRPLTIPHDAND
jgi:hypothetical protein